MPAEILLRFTAMGDLLLAIPAARALAARGSTVHWVIHRRWGALAPFLPARIHLFEGAGDLLPLAHRLRALRPSRVHDLQGKPASVILSSLLGAPVSRYRKRNWWDNIRSAIGEYPLRSSDSRPVWQRYLDTVGEGSAGIARGGHPPSLAPAAHNPIRGEGAAPPDGGLVWAEGALAAAEAWARKEVGLEPGTFFLFHPGASHPGKVLTRPALLAFLEALPRPVLIGDAPSPGASPGKAEPPLPAGVLDLRGRVPLELLPGLMAASRGLVSSDSGPMHLARAVGVPVAGIFIQTDPAMGFSPIPSSRTKVVSRPLPCKPCSLHGQRAVCPEGTWACRDLPWMDLAREVAGFLEAAA